MGKVVFVVPIIAPFANKRRLSVRTRITRTDTGVTTARLRMGTKQSSYDEGDHSETPCRVRSQQNQENWCESFNSHSTAPPCSSINNHVNERKDFFSIIEKLLIGKRTNNHTWKFEVCTTIAWIQALKKWFHSPWLTWLCLVFKSIGILVDRSFIPNKADYGQNKFERVMRGKTLNILKSINFSRILAFWKSFDSSIWELCETLTCNFFED